MEEEKRDLVEKTCNQSVVMSSNLHCSKGRSCCQMASQTSLQERSPEQRQKECEQILHRSLEHKDVAVNCLLRQEKGNAEHKKLVKALMPNNDCSSSGAPLKRMLCLNKYQNKSLFSEAPSCTLFLMSLLMRMLYLFP